MFIKRKGVVYIMNKDLITTNSNKTIANNEYYNLYNRYCEEINKSMLLHNGNLENSKKLKGAIAAEVLKQLIRDFFCENNVPYRTSKINSYIAGSKFEYDLLIIKENATSILEMIYQPEDVIAVLECKAGGLFNIEKDAQHILNAFNRAKEMNPHINFGYITVSENVPKHEYNKYGIPTRKHWDETQEYFKKFDGNHAEYAVTLHTGKKLCDKGSDNELYDFINFLISKEEDE